jgi:type I restriction enzyme S subunit
MSKLNELCFYVNEKINISDIQINQYVANDNMLKDKKGIRKATIFPTTGKVTKFNVGDVLIGNIRPYFKKVWLATFEGGCSQDVLVLRNKDNISSEYLYSILANDSFFSYVMLAPKGSKMPRGDKEHIMRYEVNICDNYKNIGKNICQISQLIENNENLICKYDKILNDFYYKNFYEVVNNNSEKKYNELIDREIPLNWKVYDLNHIPNTEILKPGIEYFECKNYLATANVIDETINEGNNITFDNRESRANMQPCLNSLWFAKMKESIKRICITQNANWFVERYILSTGFVGIKCSKELLSYLYCFITFDDFELIKNKLSHGDTQQAINGTDLNFIYIPIPPVETLYKFNNFVYPILQIKNNIIYENQKLYELRELVLNQYT